MNIHINESQHKYLQKFVTQTEKIGSKLYDVANGNSDTDLLCIYQIDDNLVTNNLSRFTSPHQFQYKDVKNNIDYIYTSLYQFFQNQASGESTINSDIFLFSNVNFDKHDMLKCCTTYKVIKGYLGFAKRDLKQFREGNHKLIHTKRGLYCAEKLMNFEAPLLRDIQSFYQMEHDVTELLYTESVLRQRLTLMLNNNELQFYYVPKIFNESEDNYVFQMLLDSNNTKEFKY
jgi:predicted nucleotidyltransferase